MSHPTRIPLPNGTIVAGYKIIELLSEGGSGLTYYVKNKDGKYFVLKEYFPIKNSETDFFRDGLLLKSKKNINVEKLDSVFDTEIKKLNNISFVEYDGKANNELGSFNAYKLTELEADFSGSLARYIIIETAAGKVLSRCFEKKETTVSYIKSVSELVIKIINHLDQIHGKGLLHLDLTPNNIFVAKVQNTTSLPIIIDFGSAVSATCDSNGLLVATSASDIHSKSEGYSAPEITRALNFPETSVISAQADIYSVGGIMYKLLTGEEFSTENDCEWDIDSFVDLKLLLSSKISGIFKEVLPSVTIKLVKILTKCLEKETEKRYKSGSELKEDINALLDIIDCKGFYPEVIFDNAFTCANKFTSEIEQEILADVSVEIEDKEPSIFENKDGNSALTEAYYTFCHRKENRNAIIISEGGAGKSYACRFSVRQFLNEYIKSNGQTPIPLYMHAAELRSSIKARIYADFIGSTSSEETKSVDEIIEKGFSWLFRKHLETNLIIFIDGLNEASNSSAIISEINNLIKEYPQISFIVTSRNKHDEGKIAKSERFRLLKLSEETVEKYVEHNVKDEIKEIIRKPLLLTVYVKIGSDIYKYADKQGYSILTAPGKETVTTAGELLWNFNQSHIVKLGGEYDRDSTSVSEAKDVLKTQYALEVILPAVAYLMVTNGKYSLSFKELKNYIETGITQLQSFDGLDKFEEIEITAKWMLKSLSDFGLIIYDKKEHSYKNIRIYHETILNFFCALHLRNLLKYDSDAAYEAFSSFAFSDEILRILGEICGSQYFKFENKNRNAETAGFEPIKIFSFDEKEYMAQKDSLIGSLIEKCRNCFDDTDAECVRNLITAVALSAKEVCGWDLSYLDFSKSYLERTKLSSYNSYSIFDSSKFSRETFEGITREEFEKQNWVYNEETDTFIGETLRINAKTGLVEQKKQGNNNDVNESIICQVTKDNKTYTKFSILDNVTEKERFLYFSKVNGLFYEDSRQLPLDRKHLIDFVVENHIKGIVYPNEPFAKVWSDEIIPLYQMEWKQFGNFLFVCITRLFKGSIKKSFVSMNLRSFCFSMFKNLSKADPQHLEYLLFNSHYYNNGFLYLNEKLKFTSLDGYSFSKTPKDGLPTVVTVESPTNPNRASASGFWDYENNIGTVKLDFHITDFKGLFIQTNSLTCRMKSNFSWITPYINFIKNTSFALVWLHCESNHKIVIYDYVNDKIVNKFSFKSSLLPHRVYEYKNHLYLVAKDDVFNCLIYAFRKSASGFFDIKTQRTMHLNDTFLCSNESCFVIDCSKIRRFSLDLEEEINKAKLINVNSSYTPQKQNSKIANNHFIINYGRSFSVCSLNFWSAFLSGRNRYNYIVNRFQDLKSIIIGFSSKEKAVTVLNCEPQYSERIYPQKSGELQPTLLGFKTLITVKTDDKTKCKCTILSHTKLSQYIYNEKYEYFLFPGEMIQINQKDTSIKTTIIPIEDIQVKIACDELGLYIWNNQKQTIEMWSTDGKTLLKSISVREVMLVKSKDLYQECDFSSQSIDRTAFDTAIQKYSTVSELGILSSHDFKNTIFEAHLGRILVVINHPTMLYSYVSAILECFIVDASKESYPILTELPCDFKDFWWCFSNDENIFNVVMVKDKITVTSFMDLSIKSFDVAPDEKLFMHSGSFVVLETQIPGKYRIINLDPKGLFTKEYVYITPVDVFGCTFKDIKGIPEETINRMKQYGANF